MTDGDILRFIRQEIARQVNVILSGRSMNGTEQTEDIEEMFPKMPTITERPVMHPYGISSAAPDGIISVVARQGEHFGNRIVLGHRDKDRPACEKGELVLYDASGGKIQFRQAGMEFTKNEVDLLEQLIKLVNTIFNARTNTIFGPQPLIPNPAGIVNGEDWTLIKQKLTTMKGGISGD